MKKLDDICVLVQARLGSQRVPQKMIRPFAGTTLMDICLEKLSASSYIPSENIISSVYEPELVEISERYPVQIFNRSEQSANSEGTPMTEMYEWWDKIPNKEDGEEDMLDMAFEPNKFSRLSCQVLISEKLDGLVVSIPSKQG